MTDSSSLQLTEDQVRALIAAEARLLSAADDAKLADRLERANSLMAVRRDLIAAFPAAFSFMFAHDLEEDLERHGG